MYIRTVKTKNKKTGKIYTAYKLVESYRSEKGPRQRIIMSLDIPEFSKVDLKTLAFLLESKLSGQTTTYDNTELATVADKVLDNYNLTQEKKTNKKIVNKNSNMVTVDLNSINTNHSRSLGIEIVADTFYKKLGFDKIFNDLKYTPRQKALAKGTILGRLINPGSEASTITWLKNRTSLIEMLDYDISGIGKNALYEISDLLLSDKNYIEEQLIKTEINFFPDEKNIFLYDLTNTYFQGSCEKNEIAHRGNSKEKRSTAPLVTLALVVNGMGFPVFSQIYKGNQSEPMTLKEVLEDLIKNEESSLIKTRSTIAMDRGIATADNLKLLKELNYPYVIIERRDISKQYISEFKEHKSTFTEIKDSKKQSVYIKKKPLETGGSRVLCLSEMRKIKEEAMDKKREERFLEDINKLKKSIKNGRIKKEDKVHIRVGRLKQKYSAIAKYYDIEVEVDKETMKALDIRVVKLSERDDRSELTGAYVIETTHEELSAEEIWRMYILLTHVENSFKALKTDLGLRPVHHQIARRTEGHLFISVLAYHLLNSIEVSLSQGGYNHNFKTIKDVLSTHQRSTITMISEDKNMHQIRLSGKPESQQKEIYKILEIKDSLKRIHEVQSFSL